MLEVRKVLSVRRRGHGAGLLGAFSFTLDLFSLNIFMSLILCSPGAGFSPQANNGKLPVRQGVVLTYWLVYLCYLFERDCCHWVPQTEDEGSEAERGEGVAGEGDLWYGTEATNMDSESSLYFHKSLHESAQQVCTNIVSCKGLFYFFSSPSSLSFLFLLFLLFLFHLPFLPLLLLLRFYYYERLQNS